MELVPPSCIWRSFRLTFSQYHSNEVMDYLLPYDVYMDILADKIL